MKDGQLITGLVFGAFIGYPIGRWHKATQHWRHQVRKTRSDWREVRRGPRW